MMFREDLAVKILKGQKIATRRRLSPKPRSPWFSGRPDDDLRYPELSTFTVNPGRGVPRVCECSVVSRYREKLVYVDDDKAGQEGFHDLDEFREAWRAINGSFRPMETVDVVEFIRLGTDCPSCGGGGFQPGDRPCFDCYGTGVILSVAAVALIEKVERQ